MKKAILILLSLSLVFLSNTKISADDESQKSVGTLTSYYNPETGDIDDGGTKNAEIGEGMVRGCVGDYALLEEKNGEKFLTMKLKLYSNIEDIRFEYKTSKKNEYKALKYTLIDIDKKNNTANLRLKLENQFTWIRTKMYVIPMGRDVLYYWRADEKNISPTRAKFDDASLLSDDEKEILKKVEELKEKSVVAKANLTKIKLDNKEIRLSAYNIKGNNFFKLRDLAYILNDTSKKFSVDWDAKRQAIQLRSRSKYKKVGGEMDTISNSDKKGKITSSIVYKDGIVIRPISYNIDGNNYFKLRDICKKFKIKVDWDKASKTIMLKTK